MKKLSKLVAPAVAGIAAVLAFPVAALAVVPNATPLPTIGINITNNPQWGVLAGITFSSLVSGLISLILVIAALLFFFMLIIGGVQWIVSGGDKAGSENARKRITSALIGLAIVFVAWAIVTFINALFGINIFNLTLPTFIQ